MLGPKFCYMLFVKNIDIWGGGGCDIARKIVPNCVTCFKAKSKEISQIMAQLLKERVTINPPFFKIGLDYCDPFLTRYKNQKKGEYHKIYVCTFVCFVTKDEIITELMADTMLAYLQFFFCSPRFVSAPFF